MICRRLRPTIAMAGVVALIFAVAGLASCASHGVETPAVTAVKLTVERDGLFAVSLAELQAAGLVPNALSLTANGEPVSFELTGSGNNRTLRFYGRAVHRPGVSTRNVYWVRSEQADVSPAARDAAPLPGASLAESALSTARAEEQARYLPDAAPGEDRWLWSSIFAPGEFTLTLSAVEPVAEQATLRLRLWAESSAPVSPDHHVVVTLNGVQVANVTWDGRGAYELEAEMPAGLVRAGENRVTIASPGDTGAAADSVLVDWVEMTYRRTLALGDGVLEFSGRERGFRIRLPGRNQDLTLWDISDRDSPVPLTGYVIRDGALEFGSDGAVHRFLLARSADAQAPVAVETPKPSTLPDWPGGADLIVVTVPQFRAALQPLIEKRQAEGLRVAEFDADEVYDAFSHGRADPAAIQALVQHALAHWPSPAPRYLLIAGDASYDPDGYLNGSEADLIPTQYVMTTYTGWTASDVWFALPSTAFEADGVTPAGKDAPLLPALAVGRLPAQTAEQMQALVRKALGYGEQTPDDAWRRTAFLASDNDEPGFTRASEAFADALQGYDTEQALVAGDGSAARAGLLDAFRNGTGLVGYTGHGSVTLWAQEKILSVDDVPGMKNDARLPLVFTVTCLSGYFVHPSTVSLGEELIRASDGGAVAALVPSSAALLMDQQHLSQALAEALAIPRSSGAPETPARLGDVVSEAQANLPDQREGIREVLLTFNLLGDPSLPLVR